MCTVLCGTFFTTLCTWGGVICCVLRHKESFLVGAGQRMQGILLSLLQRQILKKVWHYWRFIMGLNLSIGPKESLGWNTWRRHISELGRPYYYVVFNRHRQYLRLVLRYWCFGRYWYWYWYWKSKFPSIGIGIGIEYLTVQVLVLVLVLKIWISKYWYWYWYWPNEPPIPSLISCSIIGPKVV